MTSSGKNGLNIRTNASPKWDRTRCEFLAIYVLPYLLKHLFKSRFISNSSQCFTTILSKYITSVLTAAKDHVMKYSETAFSNSNVNYFWSIQSSSEVLKKFRLITARVIKHFLSTFSLYTPHYHMILSKKELCLLLTGVSTEIQKRTPVPLTEIQKHTVLQTKRAFLATRSITRINVGLALSYAKLLLSSWKTYLFNLKTWFINT